MKTKTNSKQGRGEQMEQAGKIASLAREACKAFNKMLFRRKGEQLTEEQSEEIEAIFRVEIIKAVSPKMRAGLGWQAWRFVTLPLSRASLFGGLASGEKRVEKMEQLKASQCDWRDVLILRRALAKGSNQSRSLLYGKGAERVSFEQLEYQTEDGQTVYTGDLSDRRGLGAGARVTRRGVARARGGVDGKRALDRQVAHLKACVGVYWFLVKQTRESKSGYRKDCDFLDECRKTARGHGFSDWGAEFVGNGDRASKAATNRFWSLANEKTGRIVNGELRMQSHPGECESLLAALGIANLHISSLTTTPAGQIPGRIRTKSICAFAKGQAPTAVIVMERAPLPPELATARTGDRTWQDRRVESHLLRLDGGHAQEIADRKKSKQ